jgi:hypothetical protein
MAADALEIDRIAAMACVTPERLGSVNAPAGGGGIDAAHCLRCGRTLSRDDAGAHKKFINRGASLFFCVPCLSGFLGIPEEKLREKIEYFRMSGCTLFL